MSRPCVLITLLTKLAAGENSIAKESFVCFSVRIFHMFESSYAILRILLFLGPLKYYDIFFMANCKYVCVCVCISVCSSYYIWLIFFHPQFVISIVIIPLITYSGNSTTCFLSI